MNDKPFTLTDGGVVEILQWLEHFNSREGRPYFGRRVEAPLGARTIETAMFGTDPAGLFQAGFQRLARAVETDGKIVGSAANTRLARKSFDYGRYYAARA